ncbi:hypothetical protein PF010_g27108 [Phytophthora fragariae]|uniref:Secreted protein n=1 Tax=Phytophthora fragariae TaxID=53985 RepID=A0A6G0JVG6_9STRA|nr:hypothetical protein PF010_g27108 [Phytophthora fragariae]KAE9173701.1 hypothetical protein PF004_g26886 [Phytophthora fragariae]
MTWQCVVLLRMTLSTCALRMKVNEVQSQNTRRESDAGGGARHRLQTLRCNKTHHLESRQSRRRLRLRRLARWRPRARRRQCIVMDLTRSVYKPHRGEDYASTWPQVLHALRTAQ